MPAAGPPGRLPAVARVRGGRALQVDSDDVPRSRFAHAEQVASVADRLAVVRQAGLADGINGEATRKPPDACSQAITRKIGHLFGDAAWPA